MTISVALAGAGAFGAKHMDAMRNIDGVEDTDKVAGVQRRNVVMGGQNVRPTVIANDRELRHGSNFTPV